MKAMIFAAGLGTRLRPITNDKPKALAPIHGVPILEIVIRRLINHGFKDIIVNVHHFADRVIEFLESKDQFGINLQISDERDELLDTGGGLKKASWFFEDGQPFLVHNVDTLTNVDLLNYYHYHQKSDALATLLVRHRSGSRFFLFNENSILSGWENVQTHEKVIVRDSSALLEQIAFSCLHVIDPRIFNLIEEEGCFSIIDVYLRLAGQHRIMAYVDDNSYWLDIGTPEKLQKAADEIDLESFVSKS
jgi:NDP-sugar pyrophosphorylase family protein